VTAIDSTPHERSSPGPPPAPALAIDQFARLVELHFDFIWRLLRRLGVPAGDADDAAQEVFLIASRKLDAINDGSERSFLFGTALRIAAKSGEQRRRQSALDKIAAEEEPISPAAPDELLELRRARELLDEILEAMPLDLRVVFVLFELEELTMAEIATMLGVPNGTAASRLRRARQEFEIRVERVKARSDTRSHMK
jgi:RNA polymerase sigma-70 factor, ECF subfamily